MPDRLAGGHRPRAEAPPTGLDAHPLVIAARGLAHDLVGDQAARWQHTQGVARRAAAAAPAVDAPDRPVLVAAAWLHDIGYARSLHRSAFHPLDGAWHLADHHWPAFVAGLVAHHSGARFIAAARGLTPYMHRFDDPRFTTGPVADALTYADQTTGPAGEEMDAEDRLADMLRRHGPDSPNAHAHVERAPLIRAAVHRTRRRLDTRTTEDRTAPAVPGAAHG